jgi:predicted GH43/DUF377 family glycosyl hydrolase
LCIGGKEIKLYHCIILFALTLINASNKKRKNVKKPSNENNEYFWHWKKNPNNPIISFNQRITGFVWNDPSVLKEDGKYRMWLAGGTGNSLNKVNVYQAISDDGLEWNIDSIPVLVPGDSGEWDDEKIETPMVIKIGSKYHMYYSGFKTGDDPGRYQMGHATSDDGTSWMKDSCNPVIPYTNHLIHWGFYHAAEPGAVYNKKDSTIYLYYITSKIREFYPGKNPNMYMTHGLCLATSPGDDGSIFTHYDPDGDGFRDAVLVQSSYYSKEKNYMGYSTPYALIDTKGTFHLFYDVASQPKDSIWRQVAIAHATSTDGFSFTEVEQDIFTRGQEEWTKAEVRSPCVIQEGTLFKMWYAGHTSWFSSSGIGYAIGTRKKVLK